MQVKEQAVFPHEATTIFTKDREVQILCRFEEPLVVVLGNVLSDEECDNLIELSKDQLNRSKIGMDHEQSGIRTSSGTFLAERDNPIISQIEKRISDIMGISIEHGEDLQILRYLPGQEYKPHLDYFQTPSVTNNRIGTLVMYLNDVEKGGETSFPELKLTVPPRKGTAVYFEYFYADKALNEKTLHAGTPVIAGEKWVATKWMRRQRIR